VHVDDDDAEFKGYINNLDRNQYPELYEIIAAVFNTMIPIFEKTVGSLTVTPKRRINASFSNTYFQEMRDRYMERQFNKYFEKRKASGELDEQLAERDELEVEGVVRGEFFHYHYKDDRNILYPSFPNLETVDSVRQQFVTHIPRVDLCNRNLQVVVKMSNIHLTPEKPQYPGGSWHVEGMDNEAIAATGIYYYDMHNITTSVLRFRHEFDPKVFDCPPHDLEGLKAVYGFDNHTVAVQELGGLKTMNGRCVVFPNFLHHRVTYCFLRFKAHSCLLSFFLSYHSNIV
jgi:hypothetical protein